jgi:mono/diheme cytochrome c family protein
MKLKSLIKLVLLLGAITLAAGMLFEPSQAMQDAQTGKKIAQEKCASCHSFESTGQVDPEELVRLGGPPLHYAGNKFRQDWLEKWLVSPSRIRLAGYLSFRYVVSTTTGDKVDESLLPDHPALSEGEAKLVAGYLATLKKDINPHPVSAAEGAIRAETHFEKILGCAACHQARPGQGGLSGPELYTAVERLDREWATEFLMDPFYWSVGPMPKVNIRGDQLLGISDYLFHSRPERPPSTPAQPKQSRAPSTARPLPTGRAELLYQVYCSQCHGIQGNGKGINAPQMFVAPRNHSSFQEMSMLTDDRLFAVIKFGGPAVGKSVLMPSWSAVIKDSDINLLVEYLRTLSSTRAGIN